jgi:energy-converting hydrogenase Eha subunit G
VPAASVQLAAVGVKAPVEFVVKLRVPVGVVGLDEVSVTVAVQPLLVFTVTEVGEHATLVVVAWSGTGLTDRLKLPELLLWLKSPEYDPVIKWWPVTPGV